MKKNGFNFDYSRYSDILHIHKNGKKTEGSVEIGDFTLDFGKNDEVVGVEIENASEFFNNLDISKKSLNEIKEAKMIISSRNNCKLIFLGLKFPNIERKIALPMPIVS